jgi:hypothetical protein
MPQNPNRALGRMETGGWGGIEPPTRGFSIFVVYEVSVTLRRILFYTGWAFRP